MPSLIIPHSRKVKCGYGFWMPLFWMECLKHHVIIGLVLKSHQKHYIVYGIRWHMCNSVIYPILRCMLGYTDDLQLQYKCHLMTLDVEVRY